MLVTVTTDGEEIYNLEIDSQMAIEDLKALLEAEVNKVAHFCSPTKRLNTLPFFSLFQ